MAATEDALGTLHQVVAQVLGQRLTADDCSAADLNAAIKFLKDNNITASPKASKHLEELQEAVEGQGIDPADDEELRAALENLEAFPGGVNAGIR